MAKLLLTMAGCLSFAVALLHIVIVIVGAPAYRYFGAGEDIAQLAEAGSPFPALLTLVLATVFAVFGLYGLSGSGKIRVLPFLRTALVVIGGIYALRGLSVFPQVLALVQSPGSVFPREVAFSLVSLSIGLFYLAGTTGHWRSLTESVRNRRQAT